MYTSRCHMLNRSLYLAAFTRWAVPRPSGHDLPVFEGLKLLLQNCDSFPKK